MYRLFFKKIVYLYYVLHVKLIHVLPHAEGCVKGQMNCHTGFLCLAETADFMAQAVIVCFVTRQE